MCGHCGCGQPEMEHEHVHADGTRHSHPHHHAIPARMLKTGQQRDQPGTGALEHQEVGHAMARRVESGVSHFEREVGAGAEPGQDGTDPPVAPVGRPGARRGMEADPGDGQVRLFAAAAAFLLTAAVPAPAYHWKLTPSGWGPVRMGMTRAQVSKALHAELQGNFIDDEGTCQELVGVDDALQGLFFMFEEGKLPRITATEPSAVITPRGMHVGSSAGEVRKAYGAGLKSEPHKYEEQPAEYLTFWLQPEKSGVRFETDVNGKVEAIHAGTSSIQYVEGCA